MISVAAVIKALISTLGFTQGKYLLAAVYYVATRKDSQRII